MVDNVNPTSQFHPYRPTHDIPQSGTVSGTGLGGLLGRLGFDRSTLGGLGSSLRNSGLRGGLNNVRARAQANPGKVLGGLAALVIGAGLLRRRSMPR